MENEGRAAPTWTDPLRDFAAATYTPGSADQTITPGTRAAALRKIVWEEH
ncbi:hypothetical protein [Streptomyces buecherae]